MKPRTGSWHVAQILATAMLAIFVGGTILLWSGLVNPRDGWLVWMIALPLLVIEVAYLNLYKFPQRKRSDTPAGPDQSS